MRIAPVSLTLLPACRRGYSSIVLQAGTDQCRVPHWSTCPAGPQGGQSSARKPKSASGERRMPASASRLGVAASGLPHSRKSPGWAFAQEEAGGVRARPARTPRASSRISGGATRGAAQRLLCVPQAAQAGAGRGQGGQIGPWPAERRSGRGSTPAHRWGQAGSLSPIPERCARTDAPPTRMHAMSRRIPGSPGVPADSTRVQSAQPRRQELRKESGTRARQSQR